MYLSQDYSTLFFAKLIHQPLLGSPVMLAVVASVHAMTERNNVGRNSNTNQPAEACQLAVTFRSRRHNQWRLL